MATTDTKPTTDLTSAEPERLTFELEALAEHSLTDDVFQRLLAGLRHEVTYVREGALYGCAGHMGSPSVRLQVETLAEHDDDADIREIARGLLENTGP